MTNVKFQRKEIEREIKLTPETINKISLFGTPLEKINDEEIEIEIFPNRPDLISLQGFLRAFKQFLGKKTGLKKYEIKKPQKNFSVNVDSSVKKIRPFTACAIIKNINLDDKKIKQIIELQEKLHTTIGRNRKKVAIGVYPLEKISLPISYTARKPNNIRFAPLGSQREMNGYQILSRHPTGRSYAHLLEEKEKFPIFIDANNKILSMPPIINSNETGKVNLSTRNVFVECSGANLKTLNKVLAIVATTLADMGGTIYQMKINYNKKIITPDLMPSKIKLSTKHTNKLLGLNLKEKEIKNLLGKMGHDYSSGTVLSPAWRTDLLHEVDLIEDIAIAYGYEKLTPKNLSVATTGQEDPKNKFKSKIATVLTGLNLNEISTYHLIKQDEIKKSKLKETIEVENSKTDYKILRSNLLTPLLRILSENIDVEYPQKLFEIGTVFSPNSEKETGIEENENLCIGISPGNFTEAKQILDYLTKMIGIEYSLKESIHPLLIEGRTGLIIQEDKEIGYIGEVHPTTLKNWNLKMPLAIIELNLDEVYKKLK